MKSARFTKVIFCITFACLSFAPCLKGQWHEVAPNAVTGFYPRIPDWDVGGAITFKDGVVWAGYNGVSYSLDSGKTWTKTSLPDHAILDISFLNRDTGIVATDSILFITHDRGKTWQQSGIFPLCTQVYFYSDSFIFVNQSGESSQYSADGGETWKQFTWMNAVAVEGFDGFSFIVSKKKTIVLLLQANGADAYPLSIGYTRDLGQTWYQYTHNNSYSAEISADTYSIGLDSCYGLTLYAVQENYHSQYTEYTNSGDDNSDIYTSTDGGSHWVITFTHAPQYLSGSFAQSKHAQYAATAFDGILRSTDHGQNWKNIGGPNNKADARCIFAASDNLVFALDSLGNFWSTSNSGGDSVIGPDDSFTLSTDSLFFHDTISCGKTVTKTVYLHHLPPCSPSIDVSSAPQFPGLDYTMEVESQDSIQITFHRTAQGTTHDFFIFQLTDGTFDTIFLQGTNLGDDPLYETPDTLFATDTMGCSGPITRSLQFHYVNCNPPVVVQSLSVSGLNASNYQFSGLNHDSVTVEFNPAKAGASRGYLFVHRDDGKIDTVLLRGFSTSQPFQYSNSRAELFSGDTLALCDTVVTDTIAFHFSGCAPNILSQQIKGASASDYTALRLLASPLGAFDTIILSFNPSANGNRAAELDVALDNGTTLSFPLKGVGAGNYILSLSSLDVTVDTLGAMTAIPITITGLPTTEDVDLSLHYRGSIVYIGSSSTGGQSLDIPGTTRSGYSRLHIPHAIPNAIAGYANFTVFNDSLATESVTFDSVQILGSNIPCSYTISQEPVVANISVPSGCDVPMLSNYIHWGKIPQLTLVPNPTTGNVSIIPNETMGLTTISVIDELGTVQFETTADLEANLPFNLTIPPVAGIYEVRINSAFGISNSRIVAIR